MSTVPKINMAKLIFLRGERARVETKLAGAKLALERYRQRVMEARQSLDRFEDATREELRQCAVPEPEVSLTYADHLTDAWLDGHYEGRK